MRFLTSSILFIFVLLSDAQPVISQGYTSFFDFVTKQYFDAGVLPTIFEVLGPADPNKEDSRDGISNAAVFSGRCWDKKFYRDFSTNGALVFFRVDSRVIFYVTNLSKNSNNELAPESYFDSKQFRPWADVAESSPYPNLTSVVQHNGSLMSISYGNLQGFLLRKMGENFYTETVSITSGHTPSIGEVQIVCNFFKRLEKIADPSVLSRLAEEARQKELAKLQSDSHIRFGPPTQFLGFHFHYYGQIGWPIPPWYAGNPFFPDQL